MGFAARSGNVLLGSDLILSSSFLSAQGSQEGPFCPTKAAGRTMCARSEVMVMKSDEANGEHFRQLRTISPHLL